MLGGLSVELLFYQMLGFQSQYQYMIDKQILRYLILHLEKLALHFQQEHHQ